MTGWASWLIVTGAEADLATCTCPGPDLGLVALLVSLVLLAAIFAAAHVRLRTIESDERRLAVRDRTSSLAAEVAAHCEVILALTSRQATGAGSLKEAGEHLIDACLEYTQAAARS